MADKKKNGQPVSTRQRRMRRRRTVQLLLSALCLLLPLLLFVCIYNPILTQKLADELSYARFLHVNGNTAFAEGWESSGSYFPLSLRTFCMLLAGKYAEWQSLLLGGLICTYLLYFVAAVFHVLSLRARKWITYILIVPALAVLGFIGLLAGCRGNYLLTYAAFVLTVWSLFLWGIRSSKWKLPVRIAVTLSAVLPVLGLVAAMNRVPENFAGKKGFDFTDFALRTAEADDLEVQTAGLTAYLADHNISKVYSTERLDNVLRTVSDDKLRATQITEPNAPRDTFAYNSEILQPEYGNPADIAPYLLVVGAEKAHQYGKNDAFAFAETLYADEQYVLYRFETGEYAANEKLVRDLLGLKKEKYDTVFVSMYSIENCDASAFDAFTDWKSFFTGGTVENLTHFEEYNALIFEKDIKQYYFGVDPMQLWELAGSNEAAYKKLLEEQILPVVEKGKKVSYKFVFPGYHISHFGGYTEQKLNDMQTAYADMLKLFAEYDNVEFHYNGDRQWLYANKNLFEEGSDIALSQEMANHVMTYVLANRFLMTPDEVQEAVATMCDVIRKTKGEINLGINISDICAVILGDSIFGLYKDNSSIAAIMKLFGGAAIVNRSIGGATAATLPNTSIALLDQLDTDAIDKAIQAEGADWKRKVFIIEFGLNDYFTGTPVDNEDNPYDETTYAGALRTAAATIKNTWPTGRILIMAPGFNGRTKEAEEEVKGSGGTLKEYREAAEKVAEEVKAEVINLCEVGITKEDFSYYSNDLVHYNEEGRLLIGKYLISYLSGQNKKEERETKEQ